MELLNQNKVDSLGAEIGAENVPILLEIFLGELNQYISNLSEPSSLDVEGYLTEISHALKSSAASFGAEALCAYSIEVDAKAKSGAKLDLDDVSLQMVSLLTDTKQRYQQLMDEL